MAYMQRLSVRLTAHRCGVVVLYALSGNIEAEINVGVEVAAAACSGCDQRLTQKRGSARQDIESWASENAQHR